MWTEVVLRLARIQVFLLFLHVVATAQLVSACASDYSGAQVKAAIVVDRTLFLDGASTQTVDQFTQELSSVPEDVSYGTVWKSIEMGEYTAEVGFVPSFLTICKSTHSG